MDTFDFPPELCSKPLGLVGLCGLDTSNNSLHRAIWEVFSKSHEGAPINFKLFGSAHCFPPVKPKRSSEWYIPKGLLKRNWMRKHLLEIPSVVAFLFDLNWDDPNADHLMSECVSQFQNLRASLGSHGTKLVIILIQKVDPLPDDTKAVEKAKLLCSACEIETKQLYVLPYGDHLQGYIMRLENALYELAQNYYHQEIKLIKQHKDQLNKTTQQYLFVRHQFKLGFLSELKQDNHNAKKYYSMAYTYLKDLRLSDTNIVEVKLIAGFITYKLCYLMFKLNQPKDSINHFKFHIDYFKPKVGCKDLLFEHYSWLSKQYSAFADIFDDAVSQGLQALQTQHPGVYYKMAAQFAVDRRNSFLELCKDVTVYPSSDPLSGENILEFYGQRPWRPGKLSAEAINPALELEGITALKFKEKSVNHSALIISLLGSAITQFKTYKCPRMRLQLVVQMADEYFYSKDYGKALTLFSHIVWDYKDEKWWLLLSSLLDRALSCAYVAANVEDYINFSLEALGPLAKFDSEKRKRIFNNLMAAVQLNIPEPEPEVPSQSIAQARNSWEASTRSEPQTITIEVNGRSCIEAKARFSKHVFTVNESVVLEVFIRSSCPQPIEFSQVLVCICTPNQTTEFSVSPEKYSFKFEPGIVKKLICEFNCNPSDIGKSIQIGSIILKIGSLKERLTVFKLNVASGSSDLNIDKGSDEFQFFRLTPTDPVFDKVGSLCTAKIISAQSKVKMNLKHDSPALNSEWYPININILNDEDFSISELTLEAKLQTSPEDTTVEETTQLCVDVKNCVPMSTISLNLPNIPQNESHDLVIYLRGHQEGERNLLIKLGYITSTRSPNKSFVETLVKIPIIQPFKVSGEVLSLKFEPIDKCLTRNPFILAVAVRILSPWPIRIHHSSIQPSLYAKLCDKKETSHLAGAVLHEGECGTDMFPLEFEKSSKEDLALGLFLLKWSRLNNSEVTSSSITMRTVKCESTVLGIEMNLPAHGWVRKPMELEYNLCNYSNSLLQLDLFMDASDAFMFAGQKQVLVRLVPGSKKKLKYNLYPLFSGLVALPRLTFKSSSEEFLEQLNIIMDRNLSSHVYVMPQEKLGIQETQVNSG